MFLAARVDTVVTVAGGAGFNEEHVINTFLKVVGKQRHRFNKFKLKIQSTSYTIPLRSIKDSQNPPHAPRVRADLLCNTARASAKTTRSHLFEFTKFGGHTPIIDRRSLPPSPHVPEL